MKRFLISPLLWLLFSGVANSQRPEVVMTEEGRRVHSQTFVFDGHNDLPWAFRKLQTPTFTKKDIAKPQPDLHTDIPRLKQGNVQAQFWSVYVPASTRLRGEPLKITLEQIQFVKSMVDHYPETFALCLTSADVDRALKDGKIASLIGMEGGHSIENSLGALRQLHKEGARYMTLTHSATLDWPDSCSDDAKSDGLSAFGEEVVREMNRLGMIVDLSRVRRNNARCHASINGADHLLAFLRPLSR